MDVLLLIAPSLLFVLLQHKNSSHVMEIESGQKSFKTKQKSFKSFIQHSLDTNKLQRDDINAIMGTDNLTTFPSRRIENWLVWCFAVYLLLISFAYFLFAWNLNFYDYVLWSPNLFGIALKITPVSLLSTYMLFLGCATCQHIWIISNEKKRFDRIKNKNEESMAFFTSYGPKPSDR